MRLECGSTRALFRLISIPAASAQACRSWSLPSASSLLASIMSLPIMSWYVIVLFPLLLSAPAPYLVFSMIAHCLLCRLAHLKAAMSPRAYWPLFAATLSMSVPKGTIHNPGLLVKCQTWSMTVGCVSEQVPCASVEAERPHIRSGAVGCFVACLTASKRHIPRARKRLVPLGRWGRKCHREHQSTHDTTEQGPALIQPIQHARAVPPCATGPT
jgi:hypothetical protein